MKLFKTQGSSYSSAGRFYAIDVLEDINRLLYLDELQADLLRPVKDTYMSHVVDKELFL